VPRVLLWMDIKWVEHKEERGNVNRRSYAYVTMPVTPTPRSMWNSSQHAIWWIHIFGMFIASNQFGVEVLCRNLLQSSSALNSCFPVSPKSAYPSQVSLCPRATCIFAALLSFLYFSDYRSHSLDHLMLIT
jgi:hypothetical protein